MTDGALTINDGSVVNTGAGNPAFAGDGGVAATVTTTTITSSVISGPAISGAATDYFLESGVDYPLFSDITVTDAAGQTDNLTITLSNPGGGSIVDPSAAFDGGVYDAATGVYTVSGTAAQVTSALQGLYFVAGGDSSFTLQVTDSGASSPSVFGPVDQRAGGYSGYGLSGGGGFYIGFGPIGSYSVEIVGSNGDADTIYTYANLYLILQDAQAVVQYATAFITFAAGSSGNAAELFHTPWSSATGDDGAFTLDDASLAVYGSDASVTFLEVDDQVSFYSPSTTTYGEVVSGDDGVIIENHVAVTLTGADDTVYFDPTVNSLALTGAYSGAWSTLYGSNGIVWLYDASLSIIGGGDTISEATTDDAVSLYQTGAQADRVIGDDDIVELNNAEAVVQGNNETIYFEGGSGSIVTVDSAFGSPDNIYGPGTIDVASGEAASVGGGTLIAFQARGSLANIASTEGQWDRVTGAGDQVNVFSAQVSVYGGNQTVDFIGGDDDLASFYQTNGNWDSVYGGNGAFGSEPSIIVNSAQINIFTYLLRNIYLWGTGDQVSFYSTGYEAETVIGSDATLVLNGATGVYADGGADTLFFNPADDNYATLQGTNGQWDTVYANNGGVDLNGAQASVVGGGAAIYAGVTGDVVSLYSTGANDDTIEYGYSTVMLNDSSAVAYDGSYSFSFGGAANALRVAGSSDGDDVFAFSGGFGLDTITGFDPTDYIHLSASQFANFQAFRHAFKQEGHNAVLTLDAHDQVTFVGLSAASVTRSQVTVVP